MGPPNAQGLLTILNLENGGHAPDMNPIQKNENFGRNYSNEKDFFLNLSIKWDWVFWKMNKNPKSLPTSSLQLFEKVSLNYTGGIQDIHKWKRFYLINPA